ncbi:Eco57I restriction-modification methylase domain-containing protein [Ligilactobacillus acidipiscis]|uniref:Eco57I restriction-modification methylase domain-containing protein n=1 Tax=Ligilactobacillus acidipiscis TaxID=89059 RepID=UPI00386CCE65
MIPKNTFKSVLNAPKGSFERYPIWSQMKGLFRAIDKGWPEKSINRFNGGLFKPDADIDNLSITDDIFKYFEIIDNYDFKTDLSINLLGHIFEQAINDIDAAKSNADYSSKRKKDGIFYTPSEITSFLLNETLQSWINDAYKDLNLDKSPNFTEEDYADFRDSYMNSSSSKKPTKKARNVSKYIVKLEKLADKIKSIKIIDPAVGSGSFLTQALESLKTLLDQINGTITSITLQPSFPTNDTDILSNNLFGVDINKESVEIAKLSLWLRTANNKKPLTTLDNNLKVGNSVINDTEVASNAFIWGQEFKDIFIKNRGFDIVLGNPPYVFSSENMTKVEKEYYSRNFTMSEYQENLYRIFTEKGFNLLNPGGWFGFIVPKTWLINDYFGKMRSFLKKKTTNLKIIDIQDHVFEDANVDTSLIIFKKPLANTPVATTMTVGVWKNNKIQFEQKNQIDENVQAPIAINQTNKTLENVIRKILIHSNNGKNTADSKLEINAGIELFEKGKGVPKQPTGKKEFNDFKENNSFFSNLPLNNSYYPYYEGNQLHRYHLANNNKYLNYGRHLAAPRKLSIFSGKHIIIRRIPNKGKYVLMSTLTRENTVTLHEQAIWTAQPRKKDYSVEFLLGVLNSSITSFWLIMKLGVLSRDTFPQLRSSALKGIPLINVSSKRKNIIIDKVSQIIELENNQSNIINSYQSSLVVISPKKHPTFESLLKSTKSINIWLNKNVPVKKIAEASNYIGDLVKKFKVNSAKIIQLSEEIDVQLYTTLGLTNREIQEMTGVFNQISKK